MKRPQTPDPERHRNGEVGGAAPHSALIVEFHKKGVLNLATGRQQTLKPKGLTTLMFVAHLCVWMRKMTMMVMVMVPRNTQYKEGLTYHVLFNVSWPPWN